MEVVGCGGGCVLWRFWVVVGCGGGCELFCKFVGSV